jgi:hypothetical protein
VARRAGRWGQALYLERRARSLNSRMKLFGRLAAADVVRERHLTEVADRAEDQFAAAEQWTVVEIRRVYRAASVKDPSTGKSIRGRNGRTVKNPHERGDTWRSIRLCYTTGTRDQALAMLTQIADAHDTAVWTACPAPRSASCPTRCSSGRSPPTSSLSSPAQSNTKQRGSFEAEWDEACREEEARGGGITVLPLAV